MKRLNRKPRGFTLVELMIAGVITVFVIATASLALINQYKGMQSADLSRLANGENRTAMLEIEHSLRLLGWGIDPPSAIDLYTNCPNPTGSLTCGRDSATSPDVLAFVSRNPIYRYDHGPGGAIPAENGCTDTRGCLHGHAWWIHDITAGVINTENVEANVHLHKGQIVLITCPQGASPMMLTLGAAVDATKGAPLSLSTFSNAGAPYGVAVTSLKTCHSQSGAALFLVDHWRYFIQNVGTTPWLMLDTGLDLNDNNTTPPLDVADLIPVAKNVEDMQVAYVYNSDPSRTPVDNTTNKNWVFGDYAGTVEEPPSTGVAPPSNDALSSDASRYTSNPANVRAVRVTLRFRADRKDPSHNANWTNVKTGTPLTFENRQVTVTADGYRRFTAQTEVYTRNLESRLPFIF